MSEATWVVWASLVAATDGGGVLDEIKSLPGDFFGTLIGQLAGGALAVVLLIRYVLREMNKQQSLLMNQQTRLVDRNSGLEGRVDILERSLSEERYARSLDQMKHAQERALDHAECMKKLDAQGDELRSQMGALRLEIARLRGEGA